LRVYIQGLNLKNQWQPSLLAILQSLLMVERRQAKVVLSSEINHSFLDVEVAATEPKNQQALGLLFPSFYNGVIIAAPPLLFTTIQ
jgi:hypothetical protein